MRLSRIIFRTVPSSFELIITSRGSSPKNENFVSRSVRGAESNGELKVRRAYDTGFG